MAGGLNDLELETLEEINLSPQLAARPPPVVPARRARRIVSGVALGVTLVLALITWVSLRVDTPPKARAAPDLVSTPPAAADIPEVVTPVAVSYGRPHPSSHAAQHAHHRHAHNHTRPHGSPAAAAAEALATKAQSIPVGDLLDPPVSEMATAAEEIPAEAVDVSEPATTEEVQSAVADAAAALEVSETATTEDVQSAVADAAAVALDEAMAALKEAQAAVAAAEEPIDIQSVSESERRLQEMSIDGEEEVQAPTPREPEDEEPIQAPTPREPEDEEPEIVTPAITRRRLRGGGGASWWARLLS